MEIKSLFSIRNGFILTSLLVFGVLAMRSWLVPFNHDETATFFFYIQRGEYIPYYSIPDANNHVLNSFLGYYSFKLFGSSEFALRLPSLMSFFILVFAVYRFSRHLNQLHAKVFLFASFILSYHFLTFYGMCRGYGISMSFYLLGFAFLLDYFKSPRLLNFFLVLFSLQLAIGVNMTLMIPALYITGMILLFQIFHKEARNWWLILGYILHLGIIVCWAKYSLFLQETGALYYGQGDSYWEVTFVTLIDMLFGTTNRILITAVAVVYFILMLFSLYKNMNKEAVANFKRMEPFQFFTLMLPALIIGFYVLHVWKDVNYPEDRTGLFYYPVAMLMIVFLLDRWKTEKSKLASGAIAALFCIHFISGVSFKIQTIPEYETFPKRFHSQLVEEQKKFGSRITIGGHRMVELMFAFMNYNSGYQLNSTDHGELMNTWCDYGIARKVEFDRLSKYYEVMDEGEWGHVLLKRKKICKRVLIGELAATDWKEGRDEFYEYFRVMDTSFTDTNPVLIEFNYDVDHAAQPFLGWMVFDVRDAEDKINYYKRIPMNWIYYSFNQKQDNTVMLLTEELPVNVKSMVFYIWNVDKQFIRIKMNWMKIYKLEE